MTDETVMEMEKSGVGTDGDGTGTGMGTGTKSTSQVGGCNTLFLMGLRRVCLTKSHKK